MSRAPLWSWQGFRLAGLGSPFDRVGGLCGMGAQGHVATPSTLPLMNSSFLPHLAPEEGRRPSLGEVLPPPGSSAAVGESVLLLPLHQSSGRTFLCESTTFITEGRFSPLARPSWRILSQPFFSRSRLWGRLFPRPVKLASG